jgi:hypothetical protein
MMIERIPVAAYRFVSQIPAWPISRLRLISLALGVEFAYSLIRDRCCFIDAGEVG